MNSQLTIITVCYNAIEDLQKTFESINSQQYKNFEYIIIDGNSKDGSQEFIRSFNFTNISCSYLSEDDDGIYDAINKGIRLSQSEYIGILHAGDIFAEKHTLGNVVKKLKKNKPHVFFGESILYDFKEQKIIRKYSVKKYSKWKALFGFFPPHTGAFIRKSLYERLGLYSLKFSSASDFEYFLRIFAEKSLSLMYEENLISIMSHGGKSTSGLKAYTINTIEQIKILVKHKKFITLFLIWVRLPVKYFLGLHSRKKIKLKF